MTRRHLLAASSLPALAAPPPSDRVTIAVIGCGGMGNGHISNFLKLPAARITAVCDVDDDHLNKAKQRVDAAYKDTGCAAYRAFEEVFARRDIDAVSIALPDHWHGVASVLALRSGKDVYGEKPLAHNFSEGLAIADHVARHKRIWQTGSWQRSRKNFHRACELVRNGRIGRVRRVEVGLPSGPDNYGKFEDRAAKDPPATLQYDRWLGPAPEAPYTEARVHFNWRWNLDYGGGQLMDWVGHHVDIAHWGLGFDNTGPYEVEGTGEYPPASELWNSARRYRITARYERGIEMVIAGGHDDIRSGTRWIGDQGWIWVNRNGLEAGPASILDSVIGPGEIRLKQSLDHYNEFVECVKSREETLTPARVALRSATPGWLGQIAMLTGRRVRWDPAAMRLLHDSDAEKLLSRAMRAPYKL